MARNVSVQFESGFFKITAQIPIVNAAKEIEALMQDLKFQVFGNEKITDTPCPKLAPQELDEKDAAIYIGRTVSFLRTCRYKNKKSGPKYRRDSKRSIRYPVHELDKWLESRRLY